MGRPPAVVAGHTLLHVVDTDGHCYLVDSGAQISVLPPTRSTNMAQTGLTLTAANGTNIPTYGSLTRSFTLGQRNFVWTFTVAAVDKPILGADFLRAHGLLVDVRGCQLLDPDTFITFPGIPTSCRPTRLLHVAPVLCQYRLLLEQYPLLFDPSLQAHVPTHGVKHAIETSGRPVHARPRRLAPDLFTMSKHEFDVMMGLGICRRSNSHWSSPLHMVPKPDGSFRPCGDYRRLNDLTTPDRYPVPHLHDFSARLAGTSVFSKVDLIRGYNQIEVAEEDIPKTAIITPFGLFEFVRMPFGLKNAAQTFQRMMDHICAGLDFVFVYLDDILVASASHSQHATHLRLLFDRLSKHGLRLHPEKCEFGKASLNFLGHEVSAAGIRPLASKVDAITRFPRPPTLGKLREFLGMVTFYSRFLPRISQVLLPLFEACRPARSNTLLVWSHDMNQAFQAAKDILAKRTLLAHPMPAAPLALTTDASDKAIGGVLEQKIRDTWQPLAFFSKKLRPPEMKYSTFDRELLAIHLTIRHFRPFLEGRAFTIFTDHKPITLAISRCGESHSARQQRHLAAVSEFSTDIRHVSGKFNAAADALSRVVLDTIGAPWVDWVQFAQQQDEDPEVRELLGTETSLQLTKVSPDHAGPEILCDISQGRPRPVVPVSLRRTIFDMLHGLAHPGIRGSKELITSRFVWFRCKRDIAQWVRTCHACQRAKVVTHTKAPVQHLPTPTRRFQHIHVDIVGPLEPSQGHRFLLTIMDRYTRWPEVIPLMDITALTCARALLTHWIARFGIPDRITTGRGRQFMSQLWAGLAEHTGVELCHTTAYHPQGNGLVERLHRHLKDALRARLTGPNWMDQLPWILLGLRAVPKADLEASSAQLVYGTTLMLPGEFWPSGPTTPSRQSALDMENSLRALLPIPTQFHGATRSHIPRSLMSSDFVFLRRDRKPHPLVTPYEGPFKVIRRNDKYFTIRVRGNDENVSVDRLKPAFLDAIP